MQINKVVNTYLKSINIDSPYKIWTRSSKSQKYKLIVQSDTLCKIAQKTPPNESSYQQPFQQFGEKDRVHIYFEYPNSFQLVLSIFDSILLEENDLNILYYLLYPYYSNFAIDNSQYKLDKVIESTRDASSSLNLDELFERILSNALDVIPNADLGSLWMFDSESERIICKASVSNVSEGVRNMRFEIGEGPIGYTYESERAVLINNVKDLKSYNFRRFSPENLHYWRNQTSDLKTVKSILTCPIVINNQIECVMFFKQSSSDSPLSKQDLELLRVFSSQVGIAIKNARQYTDLKNLNNILLKRDEIHGTLTDLSLQNKGEKKVILEIEKIIDKPITFIDLIENKCIPSRDKLPNNLTFKELYNILGKENETNFYKLTKNKKTTHEIYPIRTDSIILGCLIIEINGDPLGELDHLTLEQGNSVLALELFKKLQLVEFYYKNKRQAFNSMLRSKDQTTILQKATSLGIKEKSNIAALIFQFTNYTDSQVLNAQIHRLISQQKSIFPFLIQTVFGYHNQVILIVNINDDHAKSSLLSQLEDIVNLWSNNTSTRLSVGMGSVYESITQISKSYKEAEAAISYQIARENKGVVEYADIGVNRLFIDQDAEVIGKFVDEVFKPLREFDHPDNVLTETLLTYFDTNRSASETALKLHIHVNTLYQRLKKVEDILKISLKNPENSLRLQLACYLQKSWGE